MSGTPLPSGEPRRETEHDELDSVLGELLGDDALRDEVAQLQEAVRSQRDIGMAIGLVSARFGCSTGQAWRTMLRVSQDSNTKVRVVARVLVATHDGTAGPDESALLSAFVDQLPASGWPAGPGAGDDATR